MGFLKGLFYRKDAASSKKFWYNGACLTATIMISWICYKDTMEDWAFIALYSIYLGTVGCFEVVPKILAMILEFKNGKSGMLPETTNSIESKKEGE